MVINKNCRSGALRSVALFVCGGLVILLHPFFMRGEEILAGKPYAPSPITRIAILGSGTPNPDPQRSGPALAVIVRDRAYIVDFGPGVVRRASALSEKYGGTFKALNAANLKRAFLTHLHSDHTAGYPDLILTPWVMGRDEPLEVYGPEGLASMTHHILEAYKEDIRNRIYGLEPANNQGWRVNVHEFSGDGTVYRDDQTTVEAFRVEHGSWPNAFGFKFITPDRVIAISGDTRPCANLLEKCRGADILVHEVYSLKKLAQRDPLWQKYHPQHHTSTTELAKITSEIKPGLLILIHQLDWGAGAEQMTGEITASYKGKVVFARDLEVY